MNYIESIILGMIEGATEYLPISSTFHLIWASKIMGIPGSDFQKAFEVIIQGGAILAVALLYLQTFLKERKLLLKTIISFIPTATLGLIFYKIIKGTFFESFYLQLIIFALVGIFFIYFERSKRKLDKNLEIFSNKDAFIIGLVQVLAVFPGISRAGAVIIGMMFLGVNRSEAAKYSFLLAVPTLAAASVLDIYKSLPILTAHPENIGLLVVGSITSFISALIVVKWFIKYLQRHSLVNFGYYRIIASILLFLYYLLSK
jgi:undecaprenyl-diphosphatase